MQKISIALIGVQAVKFIDDYESKFESFAQSSASSKAMTGSELRAKWIELPNCQNFVVNGPTMTFDASAGEVIPLRDDLSNAIIATCKGPAVAHNPQPEAPAQPITTNIPVAQSQIYDPVWKTATVIPDQEHQVTNLQHGVIDKSLETVGPTGDFHPNWKYTNGGQQPYQESGASWSDQGAGGSNSTNAATSPTNYGPNPTPVAPAATLLQFIEVPDEDVTLQTTNRWVELPICKGADNDFPLFFGLENAIHATCKTDPALKAPEKKEWEKLVAVKNAKIKAAIEKSKAEVAAANQKAFEEIDGKAAQDSQKEAAKKPAVVDPNTLPADAAVIKADISAKAD